MVVSNIILFQNTQKKKEKKTSKKKKSKIYCSPFTHHPTKWLHTHMSTSTNRYTCMYVHAYARTHTHTHIHTHAQHSWRQPHISPKSVVDADTEISIRQYTYRAKSVKTQVRLCCWVHANLLQLPLNQLKKIKHEEQSLNIKKKQKTFNRTKSTNKFPKQATGLGRSLPWRQWNNNICKSTNL